MTGRASLCFTTVILKLFFMFCYDDLFIVFLKKKKKKKQYNTNTGSKHEVSTIICKIANSKYIMQ